MRIMRLLGLGVGLALLSLGSAHAAGPTCQQISPPAGVIIGDDGAATCRDAYVNSSHALIVAPTGGTGPTLSTVTKVTSSALAANQIVSAAAAGLYSFDVAADSTLSAAAWWIMIYDAATAPADGAVTPAKCYAVPAGTTSVSGAFPNPVAFTTGIVIGVSTAGCYTKTASTHALISGDYK